MNLGLFTAKIAGVACSSYQGGPKKGRFWHFSTEISMFENLGVRLKIRFREKGLSGCTAVPTRVQNLTVIFDFFRRIARNGLLPINPLFWQSREGEFYGDDRKSRVLDPPTPYVLKKAKKVQRGHFCTFPKIDQKSPKNAPFLRQTLGNRVRC